MSYSIFIISIKLYVFWNLYCIALICILENLLYRLSQALYIFWKPKILEQRLVGKITVPYPTRMGVLSPLRLQPQQHPPQLTQPPWQQQHSPRWGPLSTKCSIRYLSSGIDAVLWCCVQGNPLQIPLVMDTAASKQLHTGTYKLHPLKIVNFY